MGKKDKGEALKKAAEKKELKITPEEVKKRIKKLSSELKEEALDAMADMMGAQSDKDRINRERNASKTKFSEKMEAAEDRILKCRSIIMDILFPPPQGKLPLKDREETGEKKPAGKK